MKRPTLRELIPAAIVLVFLATFAALVLELGVAEAAGRAADPTATTALISLLGLCVPALLTLYVRDSQKPPTKEQDDEDEINEKAREVLRDYLDRTKDNIVAWRPKWRAC